MNMVIFIYGEDTYRSKKYLSGQIEEFRKKRDPSGLNTSVLDVTEVEADMLLGQIFAAPFLAESRLSVILGAVSRADSALQEKIIEILEKGKQPKDSVWIFWDGAIEFKDKDRGKKDKARDKKDARPGELLFNILKKQKYTQEFTRLIGREFIKWIKNEAKAAGAGIDDDAAGYLAENAGDSWRAHSVLNQAAALARSSAGTPPGVNAPSSALGEAPGALKGAPKITIREVQEFLDEKIDDSIFSLVDGILESKSGVFEMLEHQLNNGLYEGVLIANIARQIRIMLQIKECEEGDVRNAGEISEKIGAHPFVVKKLLPLARATTKKELADMYNEIVDIDFKMKTSPIDFKALFALFVAERSLSS